VVYGFGQTPYVGVLELMASYTRMVGELISFDSLDKVQLEGMLCEVQKSKTCVIHLHGMTDNFVGLGIVDSLMAAAAKNGMSFFTINTRGMGSITMFTRLREHLQYRLIGTSFENFKESVFDVQAAIKLLRARGYKHFILSGHSTGCQKVSYYYLKKRNKMVNALILLGPADDLNYQVKRLGRRAFNQHLEVAQKMVRQGRGKELMPFEIEPTYFSAKRYYELYRAGSIEGKLFNYESKMEEISKIDVPVLTLFGQFEEYAAMSVRKMLRILGQKFKHPYSKEVMVKNSDHCFCQHEEKVQAIVDKWLSHLPV